jgi:hypothetical protein
MLANMGSAGWAAFPEGTTMELKEANKAGGNTPQGDLLDRADHYARALILGQTLTGQTIASGRGGQAFGTVEAQLKQDRLDAACAFVARVINRQLIPSILRRNYGETDDPPCCRFLQETEGTYQDAQRDQILCGLGLPIPLSHLRQKYNIPEPTGDEEVTKPPPKPVAPSSISPGPAGTRPIGESPKQPSPSEKPRQVEAKLEALSLIEDDEIFARELRKLASELVTGDLPGHEFHGNQWRKVELTSTQQAAARAAAQAPEDFVVTKEIQDALPVSKAYMPEYLKKLQPSFFEAVAQRQRGMELTSTQKLAIQNYKEAQHRYLIEQYSLEAWGSHPVNAAAVEKYGIKLPEGYKKEGKLYVKG